MQTGNIDRNRDDLFSFLQPVPYKPEYFVPYMNINIDNKTVFFQHRNKLPRPNDAIDGMMPSDKSLAANNLTAFHIDLGLDKKPELPRLKRFDHIIFYLFFHQHGLPHLVTKKGIIRIKFAFNSFHCHSCIIPHQTHRHFAVRRHADSKGRKHLAGDLKRLYPLLYPLNLFYQIAVLLKRRQHSKNIRPKMGKHHMLAAMLLKCPCNTF